MSETALEQYFIDKTKELSREYFNFECTMKKERKQRKSVVYQEDRENICKECLIYKANIETTDIYDNDVTINLCMLLDTIGHK